jgi:hypothetical protein
MRIVPKDPADPAAPFAEKWFWQSSSLQTQMPEGQIGPSFRQGNHVRLESFVCRQSSRRLYRRELGRLTQPGDINFLYGWGMTHPGNKFGSDGSEIPYLVLKYSPYGE